MDTEHTKINITPTKVILVAMNENLAALLDDTNHTSNESIYNGYGLTGWDEHTWKDLSSIEAAKTNFKINQVVPDILQISENTSSDQLVQQLAPFALFEWFCSAW
jgi:hypothetical protein